MSEENGKMFIKWAMVQGFGALHGDMLEMVCMADGACLGPFFWWVTS